IVTRRRSKDSVAEQELIGKLTKGVFRITLNRPGVKNALTPHQRDQIIEWLANASRHDKTRCVVINGAGGSFCSGADLRASSTTSERRTGDVARTIADGAQKLIAAIMDCEKPVIAAVEG